MYGHCNNLSTLRYKINICHKSNAIFVKINKHNCAKLRHISLFEKLNVLLCLTLSPLNPWMLCVKFVGNGPSGSEEEDL